MTFIRQNYLIIIIVALVSFGLTAYSIVVDPIVNPDALIYLSAAEEFKQGNFKDGFALYKWPFYSFVIAGISGISGAELHQSAHFFNAIMHALAMLGFLACVYALGGSKRVVIIAAILILLFPSFNKYRSFIIRDSAFLAFYLWSLYHLFMALKGEQIKHFLSASVLMFMATLFRIEAFAILTITPFFLAYARSQRKATKTLWLLCSAVVSSILFLGISIWLFGIDHNFKNGGGLLSLLQTSTEQLQLSMQHKIRLIQDMLLNEFSYKVAPAVLLITVVTITAHETLRRLAYLFAFF